MPIVFVHGVATRGGDRYDSAVAARDALFRRYMYEPLGYPEQTPLTSVYWGDEAAKFRWNSASVPVEGAESFGPSAPLEDRLLAEFVDGELESADRVLTEVAGTSVEAAFDLIWAAAAADADPELADALASVAVRASKLLPAVDVEILGVERDDALLESLVGLLRADLRQREDERVEAFGGDGLWDRLNEGVIRVHRAAGRLAGRGATKLVRSAVHEKVAVFVGDVLTYINDRGTREKPGPIPQIVIDEVAREAASGGPLVVVAHSMGGNIVYDVFSYFRPDLQCDVLLTVGSQVGLFEELCLLARGREAGCPDLPKVAAIPNVRRWLNIFDYNDVLGYAAEPIFEGVKDFKYSTGMGAFKAHSSYFLLPSFYRRLATRVTALP